MPRKSKKTTEDKLNKIEAFFQKYKTEIKDYNIISTDILPLDFVLGGGFRESSIAEIFGLEFSGKTTVVLKVAGQFLAKGKRVLYIDAEHGLDKVWAQKNGITEFGFDPSYDFVLFQPSSANEALDAVVDGVEYGFDLVILDSLPALIAEEELNDKTENITTKSVVRGVHAKLVTIMVRRLTKALMNSNSVVIWINQMRANQNPYGAQYTTPGGYARQHAAHYRLQLKASGKESETEVTLKCVKNRHGLPYLTSSLIIDRNGLNIDKSNYMLLKPLFGAAWYKKKDGTKKRLSAGAFAELEEDDKNLLLQVAHKYIEYVHEGRIKAGARLKYYSYDELKEALNKNEEIFILEEKPEKKITIVSLQSEVIERDTQDILGGADNDEVPMSIEPDEQN